MGQALADEGHPPVNERSSPDAQWRALPDPDPAGLILRFCALQALTRVGWTWQHLPESCSCSLDSTDSAFSGIVSVERQCQPILSHRRANLQCSPAAQAIVKQVFKSRAQCKIGFTAALAPPAGSIGMRWAIGDKSNDPTSYVMFDMLLLSVPSRRGHCSLFSSCACAWIVVGAAKGYQIVIDVKQIATLHDAWSCCLSAPDAA